MLFRSGDSLVQGVIELGFRAPPGPEMSAFLDNAAPAIAAAVKAALAGESGKMVILIRSEKENYAVHTMLAPLDQIANGVKAFPEKWIGEDKMSIHPDFVRYALPLIQGELQLPYEQGLPKYAQLSAIPVQRRLEKFVTA